MSFNFIILAGGFSHRFKSNLPKPYQKIGGKSLIEINVNKAHKFNAIKNIVVVYNPKDIKKLKNLQIKKVKFIKGGKTRRESTLKALRALKKTNIPNVLIHDAARPNFSINLLKRIIKNMKNSKAVVPTVPIVDAMKERQETSLFEYIIGKNRENFFSYSNPSMF